MPPWYPSRREMKWRSASDPKSHGSKSGCGTRQRRSDGAIVHDAQKLAIVSAIVAPL